MADTKTGKVVCGACANWNQLDSGKGECRAHAPQTVIFKVDDDTRFETRFPVTKAEDWCGDFRPAQAWGVT